jgi:Holliday junction resolvasome RuvABC endonuclease subunit
VERFLTAHGAEEYMSFCYLGIDQSLSGTGICVLDKDGKVLKTGIIKPKKLKGVQRLRYIVDELVEFIRTHCSEFDEIRASREEYSFSSKGAALFNLGELGGVIDLAFFDEANGTLLDRKIQYYRIPAGVHKKFVVKNGNAKKGTVKADKQKYLNRIAKHTGTLFDDDNIADAYMIGLTLRGYYRVVADPSYLAELDAADKEERLTFFPPKLRKRKKLTPSSIYSMSHGGYSDLIKEAFRDTYLTFENVVYND